MRNNVQYSGGDKLNSVVVSEEMEEIAQLISSNINVRTDLSTDQIAKVHDIIAKVLQLSWEGWYESD